MKTENAEEICLGCKIFDARWCPDCRIKMEKEALALQKKQILGLFEKYRYDGFLPKEMQELKKQIEER